MLVGKELLEKSRSLSKKSENEIARGCGYVGPSGRVLRKSFYRALIEAKGFKLGNSGTGRPGNRSSRGRQAEFKTKVHGNGNLLIGHAYTKKLGLEPGQEYKIDLKKLSLGDSVNLEADALIKYVEKLLYKKHKDEKIFSEEISSNWLKENGWNK